MEKRGWCPYPKVKKFRRYVFFRFDVIHERDGQTDGRTLRDSKDRAYASHRAVKSHKSVIFHICHMWGKAPRKDTVSFTGG